MKLNKNDKDRELFAHLQADGYFLLIERVRYLPTGYSRHKWEDQRVVITPEEIAKLAQLAATTN